MYKVMTPGPTQVEENVRMARSLVCTNPDLDEDFVEFYKDTCELISSLLGTKNETLILDGEGILGLEAACASLSEPGDKVLIIENGVYGEGFADFVSMYGGVPEFYHADRLNYATTGTPNRLEYDQGFFVKLGDGAADVKPIAHLYKTQVFELAEYLGIPDAIRLRKPTTDTYSLSQGQDEFYFALPYDKMDLCLYAKNNAISKEQTAEVTGLTPEEVERVFKDIDQKRATTNYLHLPPLLVDEVTEIGDGGGKP